MCPEGSQLREPADRVRTFASAIETAVARASVSTEGSGLGDSPDRVLTAATLACKRPIPSARVRAECSGLGERVDRMSAAALAGE